MTPLPYILVKPQHAATKIQEVNCLWWGVEELSKYAKSGLAHVLDPLLHFM